MRRTINTEEIKPGFKAFSWEYYCGRIDSLRRELIPGSNPMELKEEDDQRDWSNFEAWYNDRYSNAG